MRVIGRDRIEVARPARLAVVRATPHGPGGTQVPPVIIANIATILAVQADGPWLKLREKRFYESDFCIRVLRETRCSEIAHRNGDQDRESSHYTTRQSNLPVGYRARSGIERTR